MVGSEVAHIGDYIDVQYLHLPPNPDDMLAQNVASIDPDR